MQILSRFIWPQNRGEIGEQEECVQLTFLLHPHLHNLMRRITCLENHRYVLVGYCPKPVICFSTIFFNITLVSVFVYVPTIFAFSVTFNCHQWQTVAHLTVSTVAKVFIVE